MGIVEKAVKTIQEENKRQKERAKIFPLTAKWEYQKEVLKSIKRFQGKPIFSAYKGAFK